MTSHAVSQSLLARLLAGERVVVSCQQYDELIDYSYAQPIESAEYRALACLASVFNPKQLGTKDQLVAWLKQDAAPQE